MNAFTPTRTRLIAGYLLATLGTAALVAAFRPFRAELTPLTEGFAFLALVVVTVAVGGLAPGIVASVLAFLAFNFFFIPPYDTFRIADAENVVVLFVFLGLSVLISVLIGQARSRAEAAEALEERLVLNVGRRNLGMLALRGERPPLTPSERRILEAFSNQLALVLE